MVATNIPKALKQYQQVSTQSGVAYASPHRLIQMLMEGFGDVRGGHVGFSVMWRRVNYLEEELLLNC